jgi:hypothetical protein
LLSLGCLPAGAAEAAVRFDGTRDAIETPAAQQFPAGDLERLTLEVVAEKSAEPGHTLFSLIGGKTVFAARFNAASGQVELLSAAKVAPRAIGPKLTPGTPFKVELARAPTGWQVSINGAVAEAVGTKELDPALPAPLELALGEAGFVGAFNAVSIELKGADSLLLADDGSLKPAFVPWLGVYIKEGSEISIPRKLDSADGVTVDKAHHGRYAQERYFALVRQNGELGLAFDWGGYLPLKPDPTEARTYVPARSEYAWAGRLRFDANSDHIFRAEGVRSKPGVPFLEDGAKYIRVLGHFSDATTGKQKIGDVFSKVPSGFLNSRQGCYDATRMSLDTLLTSDGHCKMSIFQAPPDESTCYRNDEDEHSIIPCGWRYAQIETTRAGFLTTLIESSDELEQGRTTGSGQNFDLLGIEVSHNSSVDNDRKTMNATQSKQSLHLFETQAFALVLDPSQAYLSYCFIKDVLRAAPGARGPAYFSSAYKNKNQDNCAEELSEPIDGDAAKFLRDRYGTHFAYATTYGARGRQVTTYTQKELTALVGGELNSSDAIKLSVSQKIEGFDVKASGGASMEAGQKNADQVRSILGEDFGTYECIGGSNCHSGEPDRSANLVPLYLHLRPLDELLAPPYFDDPKIVVPKPSSTGCRSAASNASTGAG